MTRRIRIGDVFCSAALTLSFVFLTGCMQMTIPPSTPLPTIQAELTHLPEPSVTTEPSSTPAPSPTSEPKIQLPHRLYYLAPDSNRKTQVWMIEPDGSTIHQVTSVVDGVNTYDVSPAANKLAYTTAEGLFLASADGNTPGKIMDIPANDGSTNWTYKKQITSLLWSPDGKTLAYAQDGAKLYDPATKDHISIIVNSITESDGNAIPDKLYSPAAWSPDGKKLVINEDYLEGGVRLIYDVAAKKEIRLDRTDGNSPCCNASWSPDSKTLYLTGIPYGTSTSDLWAYDAASGKGTGLIPGTNADGTSNYVDFLKPVSDQNMVFFSAGSAMDTPENTPLVMVSADSASPMNQIALRSDKFFVYESLWADDGSLAVIVQPAPGEQTSPFHGPVVLVNASDTPAVPLAADGRLLRWGR
jgi:WD40 repeat protein